MKKSGFTLVELLGAIALLGIIIAIAIPTYNHVSESTKKKAYENKASQIELAAEKWAEELNLSGNKIITVNRLIEDGYFQADKIEDEVLVQNPVNNENMICYRIEIIQDNGQASAKLISDVNDCELKEEEDKARSIKISAFKYENGKISDNNYKLNINELNVVEWSNTDVLLVVESKEEESFSKIFWSENGVNTITTLEDKKFLKSSEVHENQNINVEDYGNAIVVSASVLLKVDYEISVYTANNDIKNTSTRVQIDKESPRIDANCSTEMIAATTRETHLTGTDGEGSGLKAFLVAEKGTNKFETYAAENGNIKVGLKPAKEGNEIVYEIYGIDNVGNRSKTAIDLIVKNVDGQGANVINLVGTPDNNTYTKKVKLTGTARDDISGLVGYQFTTTDSVPTNWNSIELTNKEITYYYDVTQSGKYYFWVIDALNNTSRAEYEVKNIDLIAGDVMQIVPSTESYTTSLTLTGTATDNLSGIVKYQLTKNSSQPNTGWKTTSPTKNITTSLKITENGTYYLWVIDAVGNVGNKKLTVSNLVKEYTKTTPVYSERDDLISSSIRINGIKKLGSVTVNNGYVSSSYMNGDNVYFTVRNGITHTGTEPATCTTSPSTYRADYENVCSDYECNYGGRVSGSKCVADRGRSYRLTGDWFKITCNCVNNRYDCWGSGSTPCDEGYWRDGSWYDCEAKTSVEQGGYCSKTGQATGQQRCHATCYWDGNYSADCVDYDREYYCDRGDYLDGRTCYYCKKGSLNSRGTMCTYSCTNTYSYWEYTVTIVYYA